jgi:seryl-tRNA synthetase
LTDRAISAVAEYPDEYRCGMTDRANMRPSETGFVELDAAMRRLMTALDALEGAVDRRQEVTRDEEELAARIHALAVDRSRLAAELDTALVRSRRLERSNRETAARLDSAIESIREIIGEEGS